MMTHPNDIRMETNWLGRSHFLEDAFLHGCLDEVAIWGRALSGQEVAGLYQRGVGSVRLQVRACDSTPDACLALPFVGPDGTVSTYFDETGAQDSGPPSIPLPSSQQKRFIQYKATLGTIDSNVTPELLHVSFE